MSAAAGWVVASTLLMFGGASRAIWFAIEAEGGDIAVAQAQVVLQTGDGSMKLQSPIAETQAAVNIVGIRPPPGATLRVAGVEADGAQVKLPRRSMDQRWIPPGAGDSLAEFDVVTPGFFVLPAMARTLKLRLVRPKEGGAVEISWRNRKQSVQLTAAGTDLQEVTIAAEPVDSGWVLLPASRIEDLVVGIRTGAGPFRLRAIKIYSNPDRAWEAGTLNVDASKSVNCPAQRQGESLALPPNATCSFVLAGFDAINQVPVWLRLGSWFLCTLVLLAGLALLQVASRVVVAKTAPIRFVPTRLGRWLDKWSGKWSAGRVALCVGLIALVFQAGYAHVMPAAYSPDSVDYYAFGRNIAHGIGLAGVETFRTPGYPLFIGGIIRLFGDQVAMIALAQHLLLAALAPAVVLLLYRTCGPFVAAAAGLAAGISPLMTVLASYVWTESLFAVATALALLLFVFLRPGIRSGLLVGAIIGAAVLIRPTGLVILAFVLLWLFLRWWCSNGGVIRSFALPAICMLIGYSAVVLPWYLEVHKREGAWSLATMTEFYGKEGLPAPNQILQPTSQGTYGHWLLLLFHGRSPAVLDINRPYRTLMEFFDWHGGYTIARILPFELIADDRYPSEVIRESIRTLPGPWLRDARTLLKYNLFLARSDDPRLVQPAEVSMTMNQVSAASHPATLPPGDPITAQRALDGYIEPAPRRNMAQQWSTLDEFMRWMTLSWDPPTSAARSMLVSAVRALLSKWALVAVAALFATLFALAIPGLRSVAAIGVFWLGFGLVHALLGLAGERYMLVMEPLLYLLIAVVVGKLILNRPHWAVRS